MALLIGLLLAPLTPCALSLSTWGCSCATPNLGMARTGDAMETDASWCDTFVCVGSSSGSAATAGTVLAGRHGALKNAATRETSSSTPDFVALPSPWRV